MTLGLLIAYAAAPNLRTVLVTAELQKRYGIIIEYFRFSPYGRSDQKYFLTALAIFLPAESVIGGLQRISDLADWARSSPSYKPRRPPASY